KDLGIETILSEPPAQEIDQLDALCVEYGINLALHNHPRPARYWHPATALQACLGHSKRIGVCGDTGHWMRSGVRPREAIQKLEGRIHSFHLKDLNGYALVTHEVPWGSGCADIGALLRAVRRQGVRPFFAVEYEQHVGRSLPEIAQCIAYFDS